MGIDAAAHSGLGLAGLVGMEPLYERLTTSSAKLFTLYRVEIGVYGVWAVIWMLVSVASFYRRAPRVDFAQFRSTSLRRSDSLPLFESAAVASLAVFAAYASSTTSSRKTTSKRPKSTSPRRERAKAPPSLSLVHPISRRQDPFPSPSARPPHPTSRLSLRACLRRSAMRRSAPRRVRCRAPPCVIPSGTRTQCTSVRGRAAGVPSCRVISPRRIARWRPFSFSSSYRSPWSARSFRSHVSQASAADRHCGVR